MLIEGIIYFHSLFRIDDELSKSKTITWEKGFFRCDPRNEIQKSRYRYLLGLESNENEVTDFISNIGLEKSVTFSYFNTCLYEKQHSLSTGIWHNRQTNTTYLARDTFGLIPLFYIHIPNQLIAFSTDILSLLRRKELHGLLNVDKKRICSFLTFRSDAELEYNGSTFYENIKSVLPGHLVTVTPEAVKSTPFVTFNPDDYSRLKTTSEYAATFKSLLQASVARNIEDERKLLGSHLSGGLDSSSVCTFAKFLHPDRPLNTFYYSSDTGISDDREYAIGVANTIGSVHHEIIRSGNDLEMSLLYTSLLGQPLLKIVSPTTIGSLMQFAGEIGCEIIMNGNAGDSIVGSGLELAHRSVELKKFDLVQEILEKRVDFFSSTEYPEWNLLTFDQKHFIIQQNFIYNRIASKARDLNPIQLYQFYKELAQHFEFSQKYFLKRGWKSVINRFLRKTIPDRSILLDDLAKSLSGKNPENGLSLSNALKGDLPAEYHQSFKDIYSLQDINQNEERFVLANHYGFSNRSPFYDKELFELCMATPDLIKFGNGQGREHFREAMKGLLPENVRLRRQKATLGDVGKVVTLRLYEQAKELLADSSEVWCYVDKMKFSETVRFLHIEGLPIGQYNRSLFHISRTIFLAVWLDWLKSNNIN